MIKDAAGRYFASFVSGGRADDPLASSRPEVGIDLLLTHFAVLSDGRKVAYPPVPAPTEKKLRRVQRALSRKEKGSRNRDSARVKVALVHRGWLTRGGSFTTSSPRALIRDNQRSPWKTWRSRASPAPAMAKSVHDPRWSGVRERAGVKVRLYGQVFHRTAGTSPLSQASSVGVKDGPKPLHVRAVT